MDIHNKSLRQSHLIDPVAKYLLKVYIKALNLCDECSVVCVKS